MIGARPRWEKAGQLFKFESRLMGVLLVHWTAQFELYICSIFWGTEGIS